MCEPSETFHLEFNNTIIQNPPDISQIKIEPALENAKISFSNNSIIYRRQKSGADDIQSNDFADAQRLV